jgi:hypothetical protein
MQQVTIDRIENNLRNLRARRIIEEDEARFLIERGEERTDSITWEGNGLVCELLIDHWAPGLLKPTPQGPKC